MSWRHHLRSVVNTMALLVAALALPEFVTLVSPDVAVNIMAVVALLNHILSWLRTTMEIP